MTTLPPDILTTCLDVATDAALRAGALIREEFHRPGGPRGGDGHAPVDDEAEALIRAALIAFDPTWGFLGEETGRHNLRADRPYWLVDPNDGTHAFLHGHRGSAVSVALIHQGAPVLGVVYAPTAPDDDGDLFTWAEGEPLRRNGIALHRAPLPEALAPAVVVLLNEAHADEPTATAAYVSPARHRCVPSIAYRLALVAAGEGDAAVATGGPTTWDVAGGHALLRSAGGTLVDAQGAPLRYDRWRGGYVYGGSSDVAQTLASRERARWTHAPPACVDGLRQARPVAGGAVRDPGLVSRAQGCLLGQLAGDALGSRVEFQRADDIARAHPDGVREIVDGGTWSTLAGQPTDDSEMALCLARAIVRDGGFHADRVLAAYQGWMHSRPFDMGRTTRSALRGERDPESAANGSLMRVSPLAIWAHRLDDDAIAALARAESGITHVHPRCRDACAAFCIAIAHGLRGATAREMHAAALAWAVRAEAEVRVYAALLNAPTLPPGDMHTQMGHVVLALQNAFYELLHAPDLEAGVVATVMRGGDTDTNAAIAGALLGSLHGREGVPPRWRRAVLSCVPVPDAVGGRRPRPSTFWPVDALVLAERLLRA
jgi:ADP-ribosylglycohydrolase/fructose-1,6-bisphosphatase/inositol monophosphatase family enzyme